MFSPERIVHSFVSNYNEQPFVGLSWQKLLKEFFLTIYFQNHLFKHFYQPNQITICIGKETNLEVLNLLNAFAHKYSFIVLRQPEFQNLTIDLEQNYLLNSNLSDSKILTSNLCLLFGINPRYEGPKLNLKLRARILKGNFNVINIGSLMNLTFSNTSLSSNTQILKSLVEGNNLFCQGFVRSLNPIVLSNTKIFKRKDSSSLINMLKFLTKHIDLFLESSSKSQISTLNLALNEVGFANSTNLKAISSKDFKDSTEIYFINNSLVTPNLKKLLNLRLLNFFQDYINQNKTVITQSTHLNTKLVTQLRKSFKLNNHIHLPNANLFETSGAYMNTEGDINKTTKIIASLGQTKNDWQIIRKMLYYSKKMLFIKGYLKNNKIAFNARNIDHFKNYIGFQFYAISTLNNIAFKLLEKATKHRLSACSIKHGRKKFFNSQLRFWLNDFYIEGKSFDCKYSSTMIQCSKLSRLKSTSFKF